VKKNLGGCLLRGVVLKFELTTISVRIVSVGFEEDRCGLFEDTKFNVQGM
jgi:hypothetical protein